MGSGTDEEIDALDLAYDNLVPDDQFIEDLFIARRDAHPEDFAPVQD